MKSAPTKSLTAQLNAYFDLNNAYYNISPRSYNYTGSAATPAVTVTFNSQTLTQGKDYTVSFENNVNAGRASYTIKGLGLYKGTLTSYFSFTMLQSEMQKLLLTSPLIFIRERR